MSCLQSYTLKGISYDCDANIAGITRCWLGYREDFTVTVTESAHTCTISASTGAKLYQYDFARQTGSLVSTLTKDETNGTRYYTNILNLAFNKMEGAKHIEVEALSAERLLGIVEDNNGKYWVCGADSYISGESEESTTGQSFGDRNGYTLAMSSISAHKPYETTYAAFSQYIDN